MKSGKRPPQILNRGSLLTNQDDGGQRCFGYLFEFPGHGIFEPTFGKVEVTSEEAKTHNQLLSQREIDGLDNHSAAGSGGMFYARQAEDRTIVTTWLGEGVSREVHVRGNVLTFRRKGMTFRGRLRRQEDCFGFKRIH